MSVKTFDQQFSGRMRGEDEDETTARGALERTDRPSKAVRTAVSAAVTLRITTSRKKSRIIQEIE
jgi:hypothetical protein